jgi:hypothetical protein
MSGVFVQQAEVSSATNVTTLTAPSITTTAGNALVMAILSSTAAVIAISGNGNTYTNAPTTGAVDAGPTLQLNIFYASNISGGATAVSVNTAGGGNLQGVYVAEYSGLAASGMLINSVGNFQSGPGTTPSLNSVTSGSVTNSVSAMLFGFTYPDNGNVTVLPTTGTSPISFTGRSGVWATANSNAFAVGTPEDSAISSSAAATFGVGAGGALQFDNFLTVAAAFALASGAASPPTPIYHRKNVLYFI